MKTMIQRLKKDYHASELERFRRHLTAALEAKPDMTALNSREDALRAAGLARVRLWHLEKIRTNLPWGLMCKELRDLEDNAQGICRLCAELAIVYQAQAQSERTTNAKT
jgi:hypothetical protein